MVGRTRVELALFWVKTRVPRPLEDRPVLGHKSVDLFPRTGSACSHALNPSGVPLVGPAGYDPAFIP